MALFSFRHSVKTFSEKRRDASRAAIFGQTAAHLRYITRPQAARITLRERLTAKTLYGTAMMAEENAYKRKGRVCERFVIALPVEANSDQREALIRAFAEQLSNGIAGYVAAIHDQAGNDINNPHAHLVFFDVQQKSGGRGRPRSTLGLARKNAIENTARMWAELHNEMMREWGYSENSEISNLSYASRGIDRIPSIHEGASAKAHAKTQMTNKDKWYHIDQGYTRSEANAVIREINHLKEKQENARTVRLGTGDENNTARLGSRVNEQRKCGCRDDKTSAGIPLPQKEALGPCRKGRAPGGFSYPPNGRIPEGTHPRSSQLPPFLANARSRLVRRRNGVRRVYRELIMLRDTMLAKFLSSQSIRDGWKIAQANYMRMRARSISTRAKGAYSHLHLGQWFFGSSVAFKITTFHDVVDVR